MSLAEGTMARAAYALLGVVILGISAGAVYRELRPAGTGAAASRVLPDLRFIDATGAPRSFSEFRGRVVLLNLWATWCTPCREEMPALDRLQTTLGGPDFEVLALSLDRGGVPVVKSFYDELKLTALQIYVDQDGYALNKLGGLGIPLTLLIDRQGRELWRAVGPRAWDQPAEVNRIRDHLGSPTAAKDR
jgi:thiol-disulfide isomerase/thioredoxin